MWTKENGGIGMSENPLLKLESYGQSIWLDFINRGMLVSGELRRLIQGDGLSGVTSNPSIFEKAIIETRDYDDAIRDLLREGRSAAEIYEELAVEDIRTTADLFRPVFDRSGGMDGFVSLEVAPNLARDTAGTILEARRLWTRVDRPNVLIKVPGTWEGLPAIRQLISEGINVNVTLLFGIHRYHAVAEAYIDGLEELVAQKRPLNRVVSVASFFLSRIDVLIDSLLEKKLEEGSPDADLAGSLRGEVAVASAKIAYQMWKEIFADQRFQRLAARGANSQRVLWASTGTKNPAYSDVKYVEALVGPQTVNTLPLETLNAYRDHGNPALRLEEGVVEARQCLKLLDEVGIDLVAVTQQLEDEGVEKFVKPFDKMMKALEEKCSSARA
jgi:transaldolase